MRRTLRLLGIFFVLLTTPARAQLGVPLPSPTPAVPLLKFTGQLLQVRDGYVYFTTGDAFKIITAARITDYKTGEITTLAPSVKLYAVATLDPNSGKVTSLALSRTKLPQTAEYAQVSAYTVAASKPIAAEELVPKPGARPPTGRPVAVTFFVQVPSTTPLQDTVFISTDISGWLPNAMRMDRVDALHYRLTRTFASGTKLAYRYTRGSDTSVERGEDGLESDPHQFFVPEVDARRVDNVVYRWSDERGNAPNAGPLAIPTPFNPNPFNNLPSRVPQPARATPTPR